MVEEETRHFPAQAKRFPRSAFAIAVLVILVLTSTAGYLVLNSDHEQADTSEDYATYLCDYDLAIFPATSENYSVLCPIPVGRDDGLAYPGLLEGLFADSHQISLSIESSEHGVALNVSGSGYVNISWVRSFNSSNSKSYETLSMLSTNDSEARSALAFIRHQGSEVGVTVDFYASRTRYYSGHGLGGSAWTYDSNIIMIEDGWYQAYVAIDAVVIG